jgi:Asp-tRNA(Asn)/Glu-tRNA(Gln) amidotransferase A subunit family amidase
MTQGELPPAAPSRLRIAAVEKSTLPAHPACWDACRRAAAALEAVGHRVEPVGWSPEPVAEGYRKVRRVSIGSFPGEPEEFGGGVRGLMVEGRAVSGVDYFLAHRRATAAAWQTVNALVEADFDALLTPTLGDLPMAIPQVPTFLGEDWDRYTQFVLPVSFSALPAVSIPAGLHDGLPVGVQLVGTKDGEWKLLDLAAELESVAGFGFVPPPGF